MQHQYSKGRKWQKMLVRFNADKSPFCKIPFLQFSTLKFWGFINPPKLKKHGTSSYTSFAICYRARMRTDCFTFRADANTGNKACKFQREIMEGTRSMWICSTRDIWDTWSVRNCHDLPTTMLKFHCARLYADCHACRKPRDPRGPRSKFPVVWINILARLTLLQTNIMQCAAAHHANLGRRIVAKLHNKNTMAEDSLQSGTARPW